MNELLTLLNFIIAVFVWYRIGKGIRAVIECEKHLRVIAWETEKAARATRVEAKQD